MKMKINPDRLFTDPQPDVLIPPCNETLFIDSHGSRIYGRLHLPAFEDTDSTCPLVVMLHGYPGNERNFDISQSLRMTGAAVLQFSYRGVWGSHGQYTFTHILEDTEAVIAHMRHHAAEFRIDPDRIYLIGHSMGGFAAANSMARGLKVSGAILMAPCNLAHKYLYDRPAFLTLMESQKGGYFHTPSDTFLEEETAANAENWLFQNIASKLDASIPYGFISGEKDLLTPAEDHVLPLLDKLKERGANVRYCHLNDGHDFPASRIKLTRMLAQWLAEMDSGK